MWHWSSVKRELVSKRAAAVALLGVVALGGVLIASDGGSAAPQPAAAAAERTLGWRTALGNGELMSFAEFEANGTPKAIGVSMSPEALATLPTAPSDGNHCFDRDSDGRIAADTECAHTHEFVVPLPDAVTRRADIPFKWVLFNWNLHGHLPPGIYDVPHFDVHFYMTSIAEVFAIKDGPCGGEFVDCGTYALAKKLPPAGHVPANYQDVDAVAPAMGNHLIDVTGSEFNGLPFTRSWIYGVYNGRVTFWEEMLTLKYLLSRPDSCLPIPAPAAVATAGYYPTQRCVRYDAAHDAYTVSLEGFTYRQAS